MSGRGGGWPARLARLCLLAWPPHARRKHGPALIRAMLDELDRRRGQGPARLPDSSEASLTGDGDRDEGEEPRGADGLRHLAWIIGECLAILRSGVELRLGGLRSTAVRWLEGSWIDARVALRALRRSPAFALAAAGTLAVGIGGTAAVVGTVDRVLFAPPPYEEPERLGLVWNTLGDDPARIRIAGPDVAVFREEARQLEAIAFVNRVNDGGLDTGTGGAVTHVRVATVTRDFFDVLGVEPLLGGGFAGGHGAVSVGGGRPGSVGSGQARPGAPADEALAGGPPTAVLIAHDLWRSVFGADPSVLGRTVRLDGRAVVVAGVLPADFRLELPPDAGIATDADVWMPLQVPLSAFRRDEGRRLDQDSDNTGVAVARLGPGVGFEAAADELARIQAHIRDDVPAYRAADLRVDLRPMVEDARRHARGVGTVLLAGGLVLLLVTCLNIATLVVARSVRRSSELSVRLALGSGRSGVTRALGLENLLVVGLGTCAALAFAVVLGGLLGSAMPPELASVGGGDLRTGVFVLLSGGVALVLLTALGTVPAIRLAGRGTVGGLWSPGGRHGGLRTLLTGAQVALSVALMTSALLIARSAERIRDQRPGFDAEGALTFSLPLRVPDRYPGPADRARLMAEIESGVSELPDVGEVGVIGGLPLAGERWTQPYGLPGQAEHEWPENRADFRVVTSGLFDALGVRLLEGRAFTADEDLYEDRRVVIVDRALADRVAPSGSAVGRSIGFPLDGGAVEAEIVGVVERVRYDDLARFGREAIYVPYRQEASRDVAFVVRSVTGSGSALDRLAEAIPRVIREIDPQIPIYDLRTMTDHVDAAQAPIRFALWLVGAFAVLTLVAASVGVYGVVSFEAASRRRDLGLRMAVGASAGEVRRLMLRRGLTVGAVGGGLGMALCAAAVLASGPRLAGAGLSDPVPWIAGVAVALALALVASWWPAYRAGRADPAVALRSE